MSNVNMTREAWDDMMEYIHHLEKSDTLLKRLYEHGLEDWPSYWEVKSELEKEEVTWLS